MGDPREGKTHHVVFRDGQKSYGLILNDDVRSIEEDVTEPFNLIVDPRSTRYGDFDARHAHLEQRNWNKGGRHEEFWSDQDKYFDSGFSWTVTPERLMPAPLWKYAHWEPAWSSLPGLNKNISWHKLVDAGRYIRVEKVYPSGSPALEVGVVRLMIRAVGSPSILRMRFAVGGSYSDQGLPISNFTSDVGILWDFVISDQSVVALDEPVLTLWADQADDVIGNHWEIACEDGIAGEVSANGSTWTATTYAPYFEATNDTIYDAYERGMFFSYFGCQYVLISNDLGSSEIFLIGDRGKATSGSSGTLGDTSKTWTVNVWTGAKVKIISGAGFGLWGDITSNTSTALQVLWRSGGAVFPDATSHYVIYDTDEMTPANVTCPSFSASSCYTGNSQVFICYDNRAYIRQFRYDFSTGTHSIRADGTNYAQMVVMANHPVDGMQLYRIVSAAASSTFSRAPLVAYSSDHVFGADKAIDGKPSRVTSIVMHSNTFYIFKTDSAHSVVNDIAAPVNIGLGDIITAWNGISPISKGDFLYIPWSFSMERLYGGQLDDVGLWKDAGVPTNRRGRIARIISVLGWLIVLVTPTTPHSNATVWIYDTLGWHEIWRSPFMGYVADDIAWEHTEGGRPRLWVSFAGRHLIYIPFPEDGLHPARDEELCYVPESYLITSTFDMGKAQLTKIMSQFTVVADGISQEGNYIEVDYQKDREIGTNEWVFLGTALQSPTEFELGLGNVLAIRFRLRMRTNIMNVPIEVKATILEGVVRLPFSKVWTFRGKIASRQLNFMGVPDVPPAETLNWLYEKAAASDALMMYSDLKMLDGKRVMALPPKPFYGFLNRIQKTWGGKVTVTFREV